VITDPSAIIAIIYGEPEEKAFLDLINQTSTCLLASPSYVELSIVLGTRYGDKGIEQLNLLLEALFITVVPFSPEQAKLAAEVFLKFSKGRHPAKLNMGDCFPTFRPLKCNTGDLAKYFSKN
jgi:ribonuclease VapC